MMRQRFQGPRQRPTRGKDWFELRATQALIVPGTPQAAWAILPSVIDIELTDPTVLGGRISAMARNVTVPAANTSYVGFGLIKWNFTDDTVPTQVPRPITDVDADWLWWWIVPIANGGASQFQGNGAGPESLLRFKSKRKLGNDSSLLWAFEAAGAVNYEVQVLGRALLMER